MRDERAAVMIQSQVRAKQARQEAARRRQAQEDGSDDDGGAEHVRNLVENQWKSMEINGHHQHFHEGFSSKARPIMAVRVPKGLPHERLRGLKRLREALGSWSWRISSNRSCAARTDFQEAVDEEIVRAPCEVELHVTGSSGCAGCADPGRHAEQWLGITPA